ncbi:MAG: sigma-70 family RNA polymerase sigma factor [Myxococcota bacterium]
MRKEDEASDEELVQRYLSGDAGAFRPLLDRHRGRIYSYVLRSVRHPDTARDLTQDVFLKAIQRLNQYGEDARFSTWLFAIARNLCIDHSRRMKHRRHRSLDEADDGAPWVERVPSGGPSASRDAMAVRFRGELATAVGQLPTDQRDVFYLRQVEGMAFAEIAKTLKIPENTAKSRMRYALTRLQEALAPYREYLREERIL